MMWWSRENLLFLVLASFMIADALVAEFVGTKIFSLERTLGIDPVAITILGYTFSLDFTAGVLYWPVVFIFTDLLNEYYGRRAVRFVSFLAAALIGYAYLVIVSAMQLAPASFWVVRETDQGPINMELAFQVIFGQSAWIIVGSITAFLVAQLVDALTFWWIKRWTGERLLWLRATGSTFVSQLVDSYIVLGIAFGLGAGWEWERVLAVGTLNYLYKAVAAIAVTPVIYLVHWLIELYLGAERASALKAAALR